VEAGRVADVVAGVVGFGDVAVVDAAPHAAVPTASTTMPPTRSDILIMSPS
jgi:hypothetical protein